jgi:hypothetical protein
MEVLTSLLVGVGLNAACGFRVFVPLLGMSAAARFADVPLVAGMEWLASLPAFVALLTATACETVAYYIPWLDNALDTITTPLAVAAGTVITASQMEGLPPYAQWGLGIIAGGGASGLVQVATVAGRAGSTVTTGGFGNAALATAEVVASAGLTAYLFPAVAMFLAMCVVVFVVVGGVVAYKVVNRVLFSDLDHGPMGFAPEVKKAPKVPDVWQSFDRPKGQ